MLTSLQCSRLTHQGIMEKMKLEAGLQLLPRCWSWDEMSRDSRVYVRGLQKAENPMYTYHTIPRGGNYRYTGGRWVSLRVDSGTGEALSFCPSSFLICYHGCVRETHRPRIMRIGRGVPKGLCTYVCVCVRTNSHFVYLCLCTCVCCSECT